MFRNEEHLTTIWFAGEARGAPQGEAFTVIETEESPIDIDVFAWLEGPDAAIRDLTPETGDVVYDRDLYSRYTAEGSWVRMYPPSDLYSKAIAAEDG